MSVRVALGITAAGVVLSAAGIGIVAADAQARVAAVNRGFDLIRAEDPGNTGETNSATALREIMNNLVSGGPRPTPRLEWHMPPQFDDAGNIYYEGDEGYLPERAEDDDPELSVTWMNPYFATGPMTSPQHAWTPRPLAILATAGGVLTIAGVFAGAAGWQARRVVAAEAAAASGAAAEPGEPDRP